MNYRKYVSRFVNIGIAVLLLILAYLSLDKSDLLPRWSTTIAPGKAVSLPGLDEAKPKILAVFLQSNCEYEKNDADFYLALWKASTGRADFSVVSVYHQTNGTDPAGETGANSFPRLAANFKELGIEATPTLAIIEDKRVTRVWRGMLSYQQQHEVMDQLGVQIGDYDTYVSANILNSLRDSEKVAIVDVRDRESFALSHFPDAVNIPADELIVRAENELASSDLIVLYAESVVKAHEARRSLQGAQFSKIRILYDLP